MHWGWYWHKKLQHTHKQLCSWYITLDSFQMLQHRWMVNQHVGHIVFEIPQFHLMVLFMADCYFIIYDNGMYVIPIEAQPCNYGGYRYFFHCPTCDRRMRILYCHKGRFLCRKCLDLCYYTQILRPSQRCLAIANKIDTQLHHKGGTLDRKPPWMKVKTFKDLRQRHFHYAETKYQDAKIRELLIQYPQYADLITFF